MKAFSVRLIALSFVFSLELLCANPIQPSFIIDAELSNLSGVPAEILTALKNVYLLSDRSLSFTEWELKQLAPQDAAQYRGKSRIRRAHVKGDPSQKVLEISYFDAISEGKLGRVYVHLNQPAPENEAEFTEPGNPDKRVLKRLTLNGVQFQFGQKEGDIRQVYLNANLKSSDIQDRMRLAVLGNQVLDPWLRVSNPVLRAEFGDPEELPLSEPQKEALAFLKRLHNEPIVKSMHHTPGKLTEGALVQLITGMGKTEVMILFLRWLRDQTDNAKQKPRMLWLVNEVDLVTDTEKRFQKYFGQNLNSFAWDGVSIRKAGAAEKIARGDVEHLFVSFDSLRSPENRALLSQWLSANSQPVLLTIDELHTMGAETRLESYEWIWKEHQQRLIGRVGLSATPVHYIEGAMARFVGNNVFYGLVEADEIDPITKLPRIPYLMILQRAMMRGYISIALPYPGQHEDFGQNLDSLYTDDEMRIVERMIRMFGPDMKALAFHSRGSNPKWGPVARAKQFAAYLRDKKLASSFVSSDLRDRTGVMTEFKNTSQGILNLVGIGTTGLDIPDVRMLLLLLQSESPNKIAQMLGRALRKFPGKVVVPVLDPSGQNLQILMEDYDTFFQISPEIERSIVDLFPLGEAQGWPIELRKKLYKILGIDPALIGVEGDAFDIILKTIKFQIMVRRNFSVNIALGRELGLTLTVVQRGESLPAYFSRHRETFIAAGYVKPWEEIRELVSPLFKFNLESKGLDRPEEINPRLLPFAWNRAFKQELLEYTETQAKIWPHSPEMNKEVERLSLGHLIVANQYFRRLKEAKASHVFFVARDSDDFYHSLLRMIDYRVSDSVENEKMKSRLHRLVINHDLVPSDKNQIDALADIDEQALLKMLIAQGLTPQLIQSKSVSIFDVGVHGSLLRPMMGVLLSAFKMSPEDFFSKLDVQVLVSDHPLVSVPEFGKNQDPMTAARDMEKAQTKAANVHFARFMDKYGKSPSRGRLLEYLRASGKFPLNELDWRNEIQDLVSQGAFSEDEAVQILQSGDYQVLSSHKDRVKWVERYLIGKGLKADTKVAQDLAIGSRSVSKMSVSDAGEIFVKQRAAKNSTDRPINPRAAATRVEVICQRMFKRIARGQ